MDAFEFIETKGVTGVAVVDDETGRLLTASTGRDLQSFLSDMSLEHFDMSILDFITKFHGDETKVRVRARVRVRPTAMHAPRLGLGFRLRVRVQTLSLRTLPWITIPRRLSSHGASTSRLGSGLGLGLRVRV